MNTDIGKLYIVATPIGNLGDISLRALETLKEVDIVAAEDTRQTGKLLSHFDIKKPMISYFEHNKKKRGDELIEKLFEGKNIALVSDAGTPGISDPGADIILLAREKGIEVTMIPGAVAGIMAVVLSGMDTHRFIFEGFLPEEKKKRQEIIQEYVKEIRTGVFYESPHRILATLLEMKNILGGERQISLCRELTKMHEEIETNSIDNLLAHFEKRPPRGEYVLVLKGRCAEEIKQEKEEEWKGISVKTQVDKLINEGYDKKTAIKMVAEKRGSTRNKIYAEYENEKE